jgi:hypothetical protein
MVRCDRHEFPARKRRAVECLDAVGELAERNLFKERELLAASFLAGFDESVQRRLEGVLEVSNASIDHPRMRRITLETFEGYFLPLAMFEDDQEFHEAVDFSFGDRYVGLG